MELIKVIFLTLIFSTTTALSVALTGNRDLISGDIFRKIPAIIFNLRFIISMLLAVCSRFLFIWINSSLLNIHHLAKNSTTITVFITAISYFFIIVTNSIIFHESLSIKQYSGAAIVIIGILIILS
jgi:drug/metabolite transporter (DMT)-like permease